AGKAGAIETRSTEEDSMQVYDQFPHISVDGSSWVRDAVSTGFSGAGLALATDHESSVLQLLDSINGTQLGRDLLSQLENRCKRIDKRLTIVPYSLADRKKDAVDSFAMPDTIPASARKGQPIFPGGADIAITPQDERFITVGTGKGGGSSVHLHFSPDL